MDAPRDMFILQGFFLHFFPDQLSKIVQLYEVVNLHFSCHITVVLQLYV